MATIVDEFVIETASHRHIALPNPLMPLIEQVGQIRSSMETHAFSSDAALAIQSCPSMSCPGFLNPDK